MNPEGELTIQTLAMPSDTNPAGDIFGGWLVSQMDLAASVLAKQYAQGRVVTIAIHSMTFLKPVNVGNLVSCFVKLIKIGKTSITLNVEVWRDIVDEDKKEKVTEGVFVFVAIDDKGKSRPIPRGALSNLSSST